MKNIDSAYGRADALRDGVLIDISDLAQSIGIFYPVAVSSSLYNHPEIDRRFLVQHLEWVLQAGPGRLRWIAGDEVGEFTYGVVVDNGEWAGLISVRAIFEPAPDGCGVVATLLERDESYDLRTPRASLYET